MDNLDFCIAGAGIVGLSIALELESRGARVAVLDQGKPLDEASCAAGGMLAAEDPDNPVELSPLSKLSRSIYPEFLKRVESLSGMQVPFHTSTTLQSVPEHLNGKTPETLAPAALAEILPQLNPGSRRFFQLAENSVDLGQLTQAIAAAVRATSIDLRTQTSVERVRSTGSGVEVESSAGAVSAARFVDCTGSWSLTTPQHSRLPVTPRKGQICWVVLPPSLPLRVVVRTPEVYIIPRTTGETSGRALIGATVENAGFDKTVNDSDIDRLRARAIELLPQLAEAGGLEAWAGLRPGTPDCLPILGALPDCPNQYVANGLYRNGILLAPATGRVMAQLLTGEEPAVDLSAFSPQRIPAQS
ncbi:MAG: FAD-dependent oxidoreductase [Acidobacteriaceae bacterium]|nr:FAD-dependent oxidoreductase [Acidobacteriaceae bacterium]